MRNKGIVAIVLSLQNTNRQRNKLTVNQGGRLVVTMAIIVRGGIANRSNSGVVDPGLEHHDELRVQRLRERVEQRRCG